VTRLWGWTTKVSFPAGAGIFLFTTASIPALSPTQPPVSYTMSTGALSHRVKQLECEADLSPPSH